MSVNHDLEVCGKLSEEIIIIIKNASYKKDIAKWLNRKSMLFNKNDLSIMNNITTLFNSTQRTGVATEIERLSEK